MEKNVVISHLILHNKKIKHTIMLKTTRVMFIKTVFMLAILLVLISSNVYAQQVLVIQREVLEPNYGLKLAERYSLNNEQFVKDIIKPLGILSLKVAAGAAYHGADANSFGVGLRLKDAMNPDFARYALEQGINDVISKYDGNGFNHGAPMRVVVDSILRQIPSVLPKNTSLYFTYNGGLKKFYIHKNNLLQKTINDCNNSIIKDEKGVAIGNICSVFIKALHDKLMH